MPFKINSVPTSSNIETKTKNLYNISSASTQKETETKSQDDLWIKEILGKSLVKQYRKPTELTEEDLEIVSNSKYRSQFSFNEQGECLIRTPKTVKIRNFIDDKEKLEFITNKIMSSDKLNACFVQIELGNGKTSDLLYVYDGKNCRHYCNFSMITDNEYELMKEKPCGDFDEFAKFVVNSVKNTSGITNVCLYSDSYRFKH